MTKKPIFEKLNIDETWAEIMTFRADETRTRGVMNTLTDDEIVPIIGTMEFFGASERMQKQILTDLKLARFRVFDCLATNIDAIRNSRDHPDIRSSIEPLRVLAHAYLKSEGDIDLFIADLRETDYQVDTSYERIDFGGN